MDIITIYATNDGLVHFVSDAPLEIIEAESDQMQGLIDLDKKVFAFKLYIKSFEGFNNPLQQVHFYENYMETIYQHSKLRLYDDDECLVVGCLTMEPFDELEM